MKGRRRIPDQVRDDDQRSDGPPPPAALVPLPVPGRSLLVEERPHLPRPRRMLQLAKRLCLNLPDAFAGDAELLADLFQRVIGVHADAEAHAEHALFAGG